MGLTLALYKFVWCWNLIMLFRSSLSWFSLRLRRRWTRCWTENPPHKRNQIPAVSPIVPFTVRSLSAQLRVVWNGRLMALDRLSGDLVEGACIFVSLCFLAFLDYSLFPLRFLSVKVNNKCRSSWPPLFLNEWGINVQHAIWLSSKIWMPVFITRFARPHSS